MSGDVRELKEHNAEKEEDERRSERKGKEDVMNGR